MNVQKVSFKNANNQTLSARLEFPSNQVPHTFAIFAHCFTCNKNLTAVRNIARALNKEGIAVLRFDFTGLGESEGDFDETNFSSDVKDLLNAAEFLKQNFKAPELLIGHSLGGAAVIFAASELEDIKAVATIGAPSSPAHVTHLFKSSIEEIDATGIAKVDIGGRQFTIKKDFINDLANKNMELVLGNLRKPILIIHSPQDSTVEIQNAKELYGYAHHPKSFVSIDGADHLLTKKEDSNYVGELIGGWAKRYLTLPQKADIKTKHQVAVSIGNEGLTTDILAAGHFLVADEPEVLGGNDFGPAPYDLVSAGLGACTSMTLRLYADRKKWDLQKVIVHVDYLKEEVGKNENGVSIKQHVFKREIELYGDLDSDQKKRLLDIANKCPVHRTLESSSEIRTLLMN